MDMRARRAKCHRCRQATNAPADNCDPQHGHRLLSAATMTVAQGNRTGLPAPLVPAASVVAIAASSVAAVLRRSIAGDAQRWLLLAGLTSTTDRFSARACHFQTSEADQMLSGMSGGNSTG